MNNKIKLVVSDLHMGLGKITTNKGRNNLEEFFYDEKFESFLDYYTSKKYEDCEIELIMNGDIFNFLQVDYKGHYLSVITESISFEKLKNMVKGHPIVIRSLKKFASSKKRSLTYIIGNHDQEMLWDSTKKYLNEVLDTEINYCNVDYKFDGIYISHGHMFEAANRFDIKNFFFTENLPEPVLNLPFGSVLFIDFVLPLKAEAPYIDKVRPFQKMLRWSLLTRTFYTVKSMCSLVLFFLKKAFRQDKHKWSFQTLFGIFREAAIFPDLSNIARKILEHNTKIHTVMFGHSHVYSYRKWGSDSEYFNTGTWTEVTSLDFETLGKRTKLTYGIIQYLQEEERPLIRLKAWVGKHKETEHVDI